MATLQQIVYDAFRESGLTEVGGTPDADEYTEGFSRLQYIIKNLVGTSMGENLTDVNVGTSGLTNTVAQSLDATSDITSLYVPNNVRLLCNLSSALTVYLHPKPRDGDRFNYIDIAGNFSTKNLTINGNGRNLMNGVLTPPSVTVNTNGANAGFIYRDDLGQWAGFDVSTGTLPSPFPDVFDDLLVLMLAKRLGPRYGGVWAPELEDSLMKLHRNFTARYRQETQTGSEYALIRLPSVIRSQGTFSSSPSTFDKGLI